MIFYPLSALINAITSLFLGLFVLFVNKKSKVNRSFSYFCFSVFIWSVFYFLWQISGNHESALFFTKVLSFGAILIPYFYFHFVLNFLNIINKKIYFRINFLLAIVAFFLAFLSFTPLMVLGVSQNAWFEYWPVPGVLYPLYLLFFFGIFICSSLLLYKQYIRSVGFVKAQSFYLLLGMCLGFFGGSTNFLLWYNIPFPPIFNIFVTIYVLATTYAILRYRLMDIKIFIKRSAVFAFLVLIISAIYSVLAYLISIFFTGLIGVQSVFLNGILTAVFVALGFF